MIKKETILKIRNIILAQMSVLLVIGTVLMVYTYFLGEWRFINEITIENLSICDESYNSENGKLVLASNSNRENITHICGILDTKIPEDLVVLLYEPSSDYPLLDFMTQDIEKGNFKIDLPIPGDNIERSYRVVLMNGRKIIGSTEFEVIIK